MMSNPARSDGSATADRRRLLTVPEVAEELNVTVRMVRRLVSDGRLPAHRIGAHVRVSTTDLDDFIARSRSDGPWGPAAA